MQEAQFWWFGVRKEELLSRLAGVMKSPDISTSVVCIIIFLTLKPKVNFYNNWILPVEKDIPFSASCFEKETRPARFRGKFWGKRDMSDCQMSEIHLSGTRYSNKGKCHPIHCKFRLNLEWCSILILMTFPFSVTKKRLLISITEMKMCLCVVRMTPLKTILGFSQ